MSNTALPLEDFINALSSQLDRAQAALTLKASTTHLTFAVKELNLELRTQIETDGTTIKLTPASPSDRQASVLNVSFTTVTRPMLEEAMLSSETGKVEIAPDVPEEDLESHFDPQERRRLEWIGVTNVSQLRRLAERRDARYIERVANIPAQRFRAALQKANSPVVRRVFAERTSQGQPAVGGTPSADIADRLRLRIEGNNLTRAGAPRVRIDDRDVPITDATNTSLTVEVDAIASAGTLQVVTADGIVITQPYSHDTVAAPAFEDGS